MMFSLCIDTGDANVDEGTLAFHLCSCLQTACILGHCRRCLSQA